MLSTGLEDEDERLGPGRRPADLNMRSGGGGRARKRDDGVRTPDPIVVAACAFLRRDRIAAPTLEAVRAEQLVATAFEVLHDAENRPTCSCGHLTGALIDQRLEW